MITVTLDWAEVRQAAVIGADRNINSLYVGRVHGNGEPTGKQKWDNNINGAIAELAVAKHYNLYWAARSGLDKAIGDVDGMQVRSTVYETGALPLHKADADDKPFILVVNQIPDSKSKPKTPWRCLLVGWILGCDGKQEKWWGDRGHNRPCYWVPQSALNDMASL